MKEVSYLLDMPAKMPFWVILFLQIYVNYISKIFLILNFMVKNMLYSIKLEIWHYICSGKRENKFLGLTRSPSTREHKIKWRQYGKSKQHHWDASVSIETIQGNEEGSHLSIFTSKAPEADEPSSRLRFFTVK